MLRNVMYALRLTLVLTWELGSLTDGPLLAASPAGGAGEAATRHFSIVVYSTFTRLAPFCVSDNAATMGASREYAI